jgi:hypothetical protein
MVALAGLFEKDEKHGKERVFSTYVCVDGTCVVAKYRKLYPFISRHLSPGNDRSFL